MVSYSCFKLSKFCILHLKVTPMHEEARVFDLEVCSVALSGWSVFVFLENFLTIKLITQNDSFSIQVGLDGDSRVSI